MHSQQGDGFSSGVLVWSAAVGTGLLSGYVPLHLRLLGGRATVPGPGRVEEGTLSPFCMERTGALLAPASPVYRSQSWDLSWSLLSFSPGLTEEEGRG